MAHFDPDQPRDNEGKFARTGKRRHETLGSLVKHHGARVGHAALDVGVVVAGAYVASHKDAIVGKIKNKLATHLVTGVRVVDATMRRPHRSMGKK